jgi:hypothetical protein
MVEPEIINHTEYLPGPEIHDSVPIPEPYYIEIPAKIDSIGLLKYMIESKLYDYLIPRKDSVTYLTVDTMGIIKDFLAKNSYEINLFDIDTIGKLTVYPEVQYNKLLSPLNYDFYPVVKHTTTTITKRESRYLIGAGIGLKNTYEINIGYMTKGGWGATIGYERLQDYNTNNFKLNVWKGF